MRQAMGEKAGFSASSATGDEIRVLGFRMHPRTGQEVIAEVAAAVAERRRLIMANINLHGMAVTFESPGMARLFAQNDIQIMIDSMPILLLANACGHRLPRSKRTTSLDFYDDMFALAVERDWRVGYVGGTQKVLDEGLATLRLRFPGLDIDGRSGFFDRQSTTAGSTGDAVVKWLRSRSHDVVIVGMGMPLQEEWIERIQGLVDTRVFLSAGAYLDYQVGTQRPAPRWMGQVALEWAYRLALSPRRLSYRYLVEPFILLYRLTTRSRP